MIPEDGWSCGTLRKAEALGLSEVQASGSPLLLTFTTRFTDIGQCWPELDLLKSLHTTHSVACGFLNQ